MRKEAPPSQAEAGSKIAIARPPGSQPAAAEATAGRAAGPDERTDPLRNALMESRERWRDLAVLASDLAFETDAAGRFVFIHPPRALGYTEGTMLGMSGESLLTRFDPASGFNPFQPFKNEIRRPAWLLDQSGRPRCLLFSVRRLSDAAGAHAGARGVAHDVTSQVDEDTSVSAALRRGELLDHMLWRMRHEVLAHRMMQSVMESLMTALGAGGAVLMQGGDRKTAASLLHTVGTTPNAVLTCVSEACMQAQSEAVIISGEEHHSVLLCPTDRRCGAQAVLALWRDGRGRAWDNEDRLLASSIAAMVGVVREHEAMQREMQKQARSDPLTGLANRRAFFEDMERRLQRADRDNTQGVLMYIDLDNFKWINDVWGHEAGDEFLRDFGALINSTFRPTDLVARLGGDEFAVWMEAGDRFSAAERAEELCATTRGLTRQLTNGAEPVLGATIGMATWQPGSGEPVDGLLRRADLAMYQIKGKDRGHWMMSQEKPES